MKTVGWCGICGYKMYRDYPHEEHECVPRTCSECGETLRPGQYGEGWRHDPWGESYQTNAPCAH